MKAFSDSKNKLLNDSIGERYGKMENIMTGMIKAIIITLIILFSFESKGQNYFEDFQIHFNSGDTLKQFEILEKWSEISPNDAELHVSLFNYYFLKSQKEILVLNSGQPSHDKDVLVLKDSTDMVAGFIGSQINYEQSNLKKAFESIDEGIETYPNRLDMRFGKIYVLGQIKDWSSFTKEIIKTINYSVQNNNSWTWTYNEQKPGGKDMFLSSLQDYQGQLYNTMNDQLLINMQKISNAVLKHYPDHVESLANLSIAYLVEEKFNKALVPLLKAEKINPEDIIVLNNIAYAYKESGNKEKAIEYYEKVIEYGDRQSKEQAEIEIKKLNQ